MLDLRGTIASELSSSRRYEKAFVLFAVFFSVPLIVGELSALNPVPSISVSILSLFLIVSMHTIALLKALPRGVVSAIVLMDCVLQTINHPEVLAWLWEASDGRFGSEPGEYPYSALWSFRTTFLYYLVVSYLAAFLLHLREAVVVVSLAASLHCSAVIFAVVQLRYMPGAPIGMGVHQRRSADSDWEAFTVPSDYAMECGTLLFGLVISLLTKRFSERWELQVVQLLSEQRTQVIEEKVLRCQAEFSLETMKNAAGARGAPSAARSESSFSGFNFSIPSMCSAPAGLSGLGRAQRADVLGCLTEDDDCAPSCGAGMDCLPCNALVWVEGQNDPCAISTLSKGQRVLCYDSVSNGARHVDVIDVQEDAQAVDWVEVALDDGTTVMMTADHPVQVSGRSAAIRSAGELTPKVDKVVVHTLVTGPVPVSSVSPVNGDGRVPQGRVQLTVQQPDRHSILVASDDHRGQYRQGGKCRLMAVGSADLQPTANQLEVRNTFLHQAVTPPAARRTSSLPRDFKPCLGSASLIAASHPEGSTSSADSKITDLSDLSISSKSDVGVNISLPAMLPGKRTEGRISSYMAAQNGSLPSLASNNHQSNTCVPCSYAHKGQCTQGKNCSHCHFEHVKLRGRLRRK